MAGKNEMQWSSATPGLLVILLDQSGSMLQECKGTNESRTIFATRAINRVINEIINKSFHGTAPKNRCYISVIGYNQHAEKLCSGYLADLAAKPLKMEKVKKLDGAGGIVELEMPVWIEPITQDGVTNMKEAFEVAKELVSKWMIDKPNNPAPVIINVSDGIPYWAYKDIKDCMNETIQVAKEIMSLSCEDGNVLIFNAEIGDGKTKIIFPTDKSKLSAAGEGAEFLYDITSEIPEGYKDAARKNELVVESGAHGCIFNADGIDLIKLINFGSSKGQADR